MCLKHVLCLRAEAVFAYATEWAYPILRYVCPSCAGFNSVIRIAYFRVINITAYIAYIFFHFHSSYCDIESPAYTGVFVI